MTFLGLGSPSSSRIILEPLYAGVQPIEILEANLVVGLMAGIDIGALEESQVLRL